MLDCLELDPNRVFYETELIGQFGPKEFADARGARLLRRVALGFSFSTGQKGPKLLADARDGGYDAYDDEKPDEDPVGVSSADVVRWSLNLAALAESFRDANGLTGVPGPLDERLYYLGLTTRKPVTAVVLGLLAEPDAIGRLLALPALLPPGSERILVACPSFLPDPAQAWRLGEQNTQVVCLGGDLFSLQFSGAQELAQRLDPQFITSEMLVVLENLPSSSRVGAGQAICHIIDHGHIVDIRVAAEILGELPIPFEESRTHSLLYEGRRRFKVNGCVFCPDRMRSDGIR